MFDGTGPFSGLGIGCWIVGFIMLIAILMSPNGWGWWMEVHSVQGRELDGIIYYSVNGEHYTVDDPQSFVGSKPGQRTVYYLTSQPTDGSLHNTVNEVVDWSSTAGAGGIGLLLMATGFAKRYRRRTSAGASELPDSFGHGIPSETIRAIVSRNTQPQRIAQKGDRRDSVTSRYEGPSSGTW